MDTVRIPLTHGKVALIDAADAERVLGLRWHAARRRNHWYARANVWEDGRHRMVYLHRLVMDAKPGELVDHCDGNGLDCRKSNMRKCGAKGNGANAGISRSNSTGFKGVSLRSDTGKYAAYIGVDGKIIHLGSYETAEEAARIYDDAAREYFKSFACLNFPRPGERGVK